MLSQTIFEQIHLYLSGQMNEQATQDFEKILQENAEVMEEFLVQKRIKQGLKAQQYKKQFQAIHQQLNKEGVLNRSEKIEPKPIVILPWRYISVAASIIVIAGIWLFWQKNDDLLLGSDNKVAKKTVRFSSIPKVIVDKDSVINKQIKAIKHTEAYLAYQAYLQMPTEMTSPFQQGENMGISPSSIAAWQADSMTLFTSANTFKRHPKVQSDIVLERFQALQQSRFENIRQQAEWYEALIKLSRKEVKESILILKKISKNKSHPYQSKAILLLKKLP